MEPTDEGLEEHKSSKTEIGLSKKKRKTHASKEKPLEALVGQPGGDGRIANEQQNTALEGSVPKQGSGGPSKGPDDPSDREGYDPRQENEESDKDSKGESHRRKKPRNSQSKDEDMKKLKSMLKALMDQNRIFMDQMVAKDEEVVTLASSAKVVYMKNVPKSMVWTPRTRETLRPSSWSTRHTAMPRGMWMTTSESEALAPSSRKERQSPIPLGEESILKQCLGRL